MVIYTVKDLDRRLYSNSRRKSIDILFPFARVVSKRESGVLNSYRFLVDIFEDSHGGDI